MLAWVVVVLTIVAIVIWYVWWGGPPGKRSDRADELGTLLAAVVIVPPLVVWAWTQFRSAVPGPSAPAQVETAADLLAVRMLATWSQELVRRGIQTPAPVRVRWGWAADDVALPRQELASSPSLSTDPVPLLSSDVDRSGTVQVLNSGLVTRLHDEVYSRLRHGRLALVGAPGAGKTGAMILLLMEALRHRERMPGADRPRIPVSVWLTLGSWEPTSQGLREWVLASMARDHPYLRAADFGGDAIGQLYDTGRIALFLDGLDEMPETHRSTAVERLATEAAGLRVTLTSRPEEYRATLDTGRQLPYAAVVELHPVRPAAAARYLLEGQPPSTRDDWRLVTDHLKADPDGVLARTLNTPLTLSLARFAYTSTKPTELLEPKFATEEALRGHLVDQVLITAYPDKRKYDHAVYWLGWIGHHMNTQATGGTRDLRWWDIPSWAFRWRLQLLGALVGGVVAGIAASLLLFGLELLSLNVGLVVGLGLPSGGGVLAGTLAGLVVGRSGGISRSRVLGSPPKEDFPQWLGKLVCGLLFGLPWLVAGVVWTELLLLLPVGTLFGLAFGSWSGVRAGLRALWFSVDRRDRISAGDWAS